MGGPPLEFINNPAPKRGSASRIHEHTAPKKGVRLQNSSTKGGLPLDFINQKGVCLQISSTKKGIPSTKKGVRLQGQFLQIQQYQFFIVFQTHQPRLTLMCGTSMIQEPHKCDRSTYRFTQLKYQKGRSFFLCCNQRSSSAKKNVECAFAKQTFTRNYSIYIFTVSFQCLFSTLLIQFKLVYECLVKSNMHNTFDFCPRPARKEPNVPLKQYSPTDKIFVNKLYAVIHKTQKSLTKIL